MKGAFLDGIELEHRRRLNNLLDARRIVDARKLNQQFRIVFTASALLHGAFGHAQRVNALVDGREGPVQRVAPQGQRRRLLDGEAQVVAGTAQIPLLPILFGNDGARFTSLIGVEALDRDLNLAGVGQGLRIVAIQCAVGDATFAEFVAQPLDYLVGFGAECILHLYLDDQLAATLQVETELDVVVEIIDKLFLALR